jgi:sodium pump decarboxylase gamma subunit
MKDIGFGITMTVMGMGVTFLTLLLLIVIIRLLLKFLPYKKEEESGKDTK